MSWLTRKRLCYALELLTLQSVAMDTIYPTHTGVTTPEVKAALERLPFLNSTFFHHRAGSWHQTVGPQKPGKGWEMGLMHTQTVSLQLPLGMTEASNSAVSA